MSIHNANSEASTLNREGFCDGASHDTRHVIRRAEHFSEASGGAFDITVLPLLKLWEERAGTGEAPGDGEINRALELVGHRNVAVEDGNIRLNKPGAGITLAGAAKGYAVDRAAEVLRQAGMEHGLVNGGGDIRVIGGKTDKSPWRIAVRDPRRKGQAAAFELRDKAVATSGTYQRRSNDMINPRTGHPVRGLLSSTVIAGRALDADILATCAYILGADKGMEMLRRLGGVQALLITEDGDTLRFPASGQVTTAI
jgi:thiamine biosynthesis lipoprotein